MHRKEFRFVLEGEVYHAPLGSIEQLLRAGSVREDLLIEVDGQSRTLREVLKKETFPPPRFVLPTTTAMSIFRPFFVLGLVLVLFFSSWILNDPDAPRVLPGFGPTQRICPNCHGGGSVNRSGCSGRGFEGLGADRHCCRCRGTGFVNE